MYDDEYNRGVANTVLKRSGRKALNVDRLNGSGARTASDGDRTKHPASYWFKQENEVFKDDITRPDVEPESVVRERANLDLGSGRCRGGMVGMPDRGSLSNVEPNSVIRERAGLDLGAGRSGGGMSGGFWGALAGLALPLIGQLLGKGNSGSGASGGIASMYLKKEIGKGQMTKMIKGILPHGQKKMAGGISSAICREFGSKRGKGYSGGAQDFDEDDEQDEELEGGAMPLRQTGYGMSCGPADRQVGGKVCKCKCKCGAGYSGGGLSGGYGPVAPTTESLYGYDNRDQPKGLKPPPSVNQQEGMGDAQYVGSGRKKGGFFGSMGRMLMGPIGSMLMGQGQRPASMSELGRNMLPVSQLPSGTGGGRMCPQNYDPVTDPESGQTYGNKCKMNAAKGRGRSGGRAFANTTNYASNSGNFLPSLQSRVSIGSGARSARGAMVSKLMKEKGTSLGEASRYIKEHKS